MNMAGAFGGLLAGLVVAWQGYGTLTAAAGALTLPVIVLVLAGRRVAEVVASDMPSQPIVEGDVGARADEDRDHGEHR